jgi:hypothetical protein
VRLVSSSLRGHRNKLLFNELRKRSDLNVAFLAVPFRVLKFLPSVAQQFGQFVHMVLQPLAFVGKTVDVVVVPLVLDI